MSYKWWYGLSPEGIQNTLNREIQIRDDRIEELEKENFTLAATQCPFPDGEGLTGSPSGYSYCAKDVELEGCDEYIQSLIKTIEEADEQIEELEAKLEAAEKIGFDERSSRYGITSYDDWWWAWWDNDYDVGMINTHGDELYTPTEAREYVPADRIEELEAKLEKTVTALKFYRSAINLRIDCEITYAMQEAHDNARITLAELKGETK